MNIHKRQSNKQVFFSLEFVNILLQIEAKAVKNASSLLKFSGHSELENGLFIQLKNSFSKHIIIIIIIIINIAIIVVIIIINDHLSKKA